MMNNYNPLVTIAIPTYNRADGYLKQCLKSAINQTYSNIEIIVSDNCSPDHTESIVTNISDQRIQYFRQKINIGANNNFNYLLGKAKGDYFLLLQDDDLIDDDFLEICMKAVNYSPEIGLIRTGVRTIDSNNLVISEQENIAGGLSTEDFFLAFFNRRISMLLAGTLFNARKLKDIGGFESKHNRWQDVYAEFQLAARFGRVDVKDVKASFRIHPAQMTFNVNIMEWCEDALFLLDAMCEWASGKKNVIRRDGMRSFAHHSYHVAEQIKSPLKRFIAYITVLRMFNYRYMPKNTKSIIYNAPLLYPLRYIKRRMKKVLGYS